MADDVAGRMAVRTWFDAARQHVGIELREEGTPLAHITLELPEFSGLMRDLARYRAMFADEVPFALEPLARLEAAKFTAWQVMTEVPGLPPGAVLMMLRHPAHGWVGLWMSPQEARDLAAALSRGARAE